MKFELPEDRERKIAEQYNKPLQPIPRDTDWSIKAALRIASETSRLLAEPYITQIARIIREEQPKP